MGCQRNTCCCYWWSVGTHACKPADAAILAPPLPLFTCRLVINPNGNLALIDGDNTTLWTSQSACLPGVVPGASNMGYCVQDSGEVVVQTGAGSRLWSSAMPGGVLQGSSGVKQQLISHSTSQMACLLGEQVLVSRFNEVRLTASSPVGLLQLQQADSGGLRLWATQQYAGVTLPYGVCIRNDGMLRFSSAGGGRQLWNTSAAAAQSGPFTVLVGDEALEVSWLWEHEAQVLASRAHAHGSRHRARVYATTCTCTSCAQHCA